MIADEDIAVERGTGSYCAKANYDHENEIMICDLSEDVCFAWLNDLDEKFCGDFSENANGERR